MLALTGFCKRFIWQLVGLPHTIGAGWFSLLFAAVSVYGCSTQPKNPAEVYDLRRRGESQLEQGNRQADRGNFESALILLNEAFRLAVATDDPGLRIRTGLSCGNVLFSMKRADEAAECWNAALAETRRNGNAELAAVCRIHIARGKLLSRGADAAVLRDEITQDIVFIKKERLYTAFAWTVVGLAEKELLRYGEAETAVRRGLEIHEKDGYFELAAYDWFMIASFRSLAGNFDSAASALNTAIEFDRRIENSWGLASDWRALGDVLKKAGDGEASRAAYTRAAEIFTALGNGGMASEALSRVGGG